MKWHDRKGFRDMLRVELEENGELPGLVEDLIRIIHRSKLEKWQFIDELHSIESKIAYVRQTMEGPMV